MQIPLLLAIFFLFTVFSAGAQNGPQSDLHVSSGESTDLLGGAQSSPVALQAGDGKIPDLQVLLTGLEMAQRTNHSHMVPFTVTREYKLLKGEEREVVGTVVAEVHFQPPSTKTFSIKTATGSGRAETVVKTILEHEVRWTKEAKIAIGRESYDFRLVGTGESDHRPCYILQLIPKRADSDLLRGRIWVDRNTYLIHRFEGSPAKNPSWWLKDVMISSSYGELGGVWLPTSGEGTADVRLLGSHSVTERTLSYHAEHTVVEGPAAETTRLARAHGLRSYHPSASVAVSVISPK